MTYPPGTKWHQRRWVRAIGAVLAAALILVIGGTAAVASHLGGSGAQPKPTASASPSASKRVVKAPSAAATRTPTPAATSAAPSSTASAGAQAPVKTCTNPTAEPPNFVAFNFPHTPDTTWWTDLTAGIQAKNLPIKATPVIGFDDPGNATVLNVVKIIEAHCLPAGVNLGSFYNNGGIARVLDLVNALKGSDVARYFVSADDIKGGDQTAVNDLVDAVRGTGAKVSTGSDLWGGLSDTYKHMSGFHGDSTSVAYYPYIGSVKYGPMSALRTVAGAADFMANGTNGVAWVQDFDWRKADPVDAAQFGFPNTHISTADVVRMYVLQAKVHNAFVNALEPRSDNIPTMITDICAVVAAVYVNSGGQCSCGS